MNNADGGNVLFHFKGDSKDLDKKTSTISGKLKGMGSLLATSMVAGTAIAGAAVGKFVKDATTSFAEFEQLEGGLEAMFKGNATEIQRVSEISQKAYKDLQMSQNEYLKSFESSYAIVKNGLSDNADAIEYTNKILQLSADLFNTYGGSTEQYSNAINWALKGNYSYIDNLNLGIKGTQEGFVEAANNCGVLGREISNVSELTNDEIIDVIQAYAEETGAWGRSTEEASKTIAGSLNMTKSSWADLLNEFGKENGNIEGAFDNFLTSAEALGNNLMPVLERVLNTFLTHLPGMINTIATSLPGLIQTLVPTLIQSAVGVFQALVNALPQLINVLAQMLPGILDSLIKGLIDIVNALSEQLPTLIPVIVNAIMEIIPVLINNLPLFIEAGFKLLIGLGKGIINSIPTLLHNYLPKLVKSIINYFKTMPGKMLGIGGDIVKGLWRGMGNLKDWVVNKVKGMGKSILNSLKNILGIHSPSTEFALLGKFSVLGYTEALDDMQPEIQKTIDSLFDLNPNVVGTTALHYSPNVIVNNQMNMTTDPLGQVVGNIKTFANGSKNDYNYGMGA